MLNDEFYEIADREYHNTRNRAIEKSGSRELSRIERQILRGNSDEC